MLNVPNALDDFAGFFDRAWRLATAPLRTPGRYRGVLISHTPLDKRRIAPLLFICSYRCATLQIESDLNLLTVGTSDALSALMAVLGAIKSSYRRVTSRCESADYQRWRLR